MTKFVVEFLTTNRHGGLEDREVRVVAKSADEARAAVQAKYPQAAIGHVEAAA